MSNTSTTNQTVLVTGAAGFLGSNLSHSLINEGYTVFGIDNFSTGNKETISDLIDHPRFTFIEEDITRDSFLSHFTDVTLDRIYNIACPTGVPNIQPLCEEMLMTCSVGLKNVLDLAKEKNARLLYTSTAEVYGNPEVFPQTEDYCGNVDPVGMRSPYEEGKRFGEALLMAYVRKYDVDARIVRVFNTYGPRMSLEDFRVMPNFLKKILNNENPRIYGDGSQNRTFIYVDDLIKGLLTAMEKGSNGEVYNIGGTEQVTIKELAELMIKLTNSDSSIDYEEHFIEDHLGRKPDVSKAEGLGWKQKVTLTDGLTRYIESVKKKTR